MSHRILLVEDDRLIQDMVSGILTAHGHRVDAWEDGVSGVEALCRGGYDLALIDYHLPEIDGYASARLVGSIVSEDRRPKLVAITADPGSLADRERSITAFDAVLPKPFDPDALCRLIERLMQNSGSDAASRASRALWAERGLASRPRCYPVPEPTVEQGLAIDKCFDRAPDPGSADVLLLLDGGCLPELAAARRSGGHLLPAVDLTGERARELDCVFRPDARDTWSKVAESIAGFRRRAAELSPTVRDGLIDRALCTDLRGGKSAALNLGISACSGDIVVNVDCDCSYERFALLEILRPFENAEVGAVCGDIVPRNGDASLVAKLQEIEYLLTVSVGKRLGNAVDQVVRLSGAFTAFRRKALDSVDGFDVGGGEDLDITLRLRSRGWRVAFAPKAICRTDVPATAWALTRQRLRWERDSVRIRFRKLRDTMRP